MKGWTIRQRLCVGAAHLFSYSPYQIFLVACDETFLLSYPYFGLYSTVGSFSADSYSTASKNILYSCFRFTKLEDFSGWCPLPRHSPACSSQSLVLSCPSSPWSLRWCFSSLNLFSFSSSAHSQLSRLKPKMGSHQYRGSSSTWGAWAEGAFRRASSSERRLLLTKLKEWQTRTAEDPAFGTSSSKFLVLLLIICVLLLCLFESFVEWEIGWNFPRNLLIVFDVYWLMVTLDRVWNRKDCR